MSKIQRQSVKKDTEVGSLSDLINDDQIYIGASSLNKTLKSAINAGDFALPNLDWTAWTPTFSTGSGTVTEIACYYLRLGQTMLAWGTFRVGTTSANHIYFSLPSSLSIDYSAGGGPIVADQTPIGYFQRYDSGVVVGGDGGNQGLIFCDTTQGAGQFAVAKTLTGITLTKANWTNLFASSNRAGFWLQVPIYEWR